MKTPEEIAQWIIDNRYPKSEQEKVSDHEMFYTITENIGKLIAVEKTCYNCKYKEHDPRSQFSKCYDCMDFSNHKL